MSRERGPGRALLHPLAVLSLLLLIANDHWLKHAHPGVLSGKLSGFAAVLLLPLFLHALFELSYRASTRRLPSARVANRALCACLAVTCLVYAPPELWPPAETAYRYGLGALQWPFRGLWSLVRGEPAAGFLPVRATADPSDLVALIMLWVAWRVAKRGPRKTRPRALITTTALLFALASLSAPRSAAAVGNSQPRSHDGFYASLEIGAEGLFLQSPASVSNGFRQAIPSSATGISLPSGSLELGGTLRGTGLVLGGTISRLQVQDPIVSTLGTRFELRNASLESLRFGAFGRYYPDPQAGLSLGLGAGLMILEMPSSAGQQLEGVYVGLEAGYSAWISAEWSLGFNARVTGAGLGGELAGATWVLMPGVFVALAWH
ncbi:MAG TPA: hypothetical protein VER04_06560 [Polyangiaceae bacterium]|nr:hypothetical protein [Polyangiaceae bacterium]